ncbi:MAG TPA: hypothetical protein VIJ69_00040 [Actinomycetota bacterium]
MGTRLRRLNEPFVVAAPAGARIRTRLRVSPCDEEVLSALGTHLGSLIGGDLAERCRQGRLDARQAAASRAGRKRAATAASSSRWAGAITRSSEDAWQAAYRNLGATAASLRARVRVIEGRLAVPAGGRPGRVRGYASPRERFDKQRRLLVLQARLQDVETRLDIARVSVCRGGRRLARVRHHLEDAGLSAEAWTRRWRAARLFICADGEADKARGNETIRWHPDEGWLELKLPASLAQLANRPHGRYRLSCPVKFSHRADEVAAQTASGAVRYDITFHPDRNRWYVDASWRLPATPPQSVDELRREGMLAIDVNAGHLATILVDASGNPVGRPLTIPLQTAGLPATTRDGHLRAAISQLLEAAQKAGCKAICIEDLDFARVRAEGRERTSRRPSRGRRGRRFRGLVAGIPTGRFRDRLVQMAANKGLCVIAVDPAYSSRWGLQHWFEVIRQASPEASGHHAACLVIGRRGLGQRARRRGGCDQRRPADRQWRAIDSAVQPTPAPAAGLPGVHPRKPRVPEARGRPHQRRKTQPADGHPLGDQAAQDRSGPPTGQDSLTLSV